MLLQFKRKKNYERSLKKYCMRFLRLEELSVGIWEHNDVLFCFTFKKPV